MAKDYDIIKKHYGEKFAQYCRANFPTILEQGEGVLANHIISLFAPNKSLYDDLIDNELEYDAKSYIQGAYFRQKANTDPQPEPHPSILMQKAGYILYECSTVADVQRFKQFWKPTEALCTFNNIPGRLDRCHIFFAVKDNATILRRENFKNPRRQDEYGTSVISLQFNKGEYNDVSIKNRYNHAVDDPDATFSNDLENIYPGLTDSFAQHYGYNFHPANKGLQLPGYTTANDGRRYKYNLESDAVYFCGDNTIIKDGVVTQLDKFTKILVGNYIFDIQNKTIKKYQTKSSDDIECNFNAHPKYADLTGKVREKALQEFTKIVLSDAFVDSFEKIVKMDVVKGKTQGSRVIEITEESGNKVYIEIDKNNNMVSFVNNHVAEVGDDFLSQFRKLGYIQMDNMQHCGYNFAYATSALKNVSFPNLISCKGSFLYADSQILSFNAPKLTKVGNNFCRMDMALRQLSLPNLKECGNDFFSCNSNLEEIDVSNLRFCGNAFLKNNDTLKILTVNNLQVCGNEFLRNNQILKVLRANSLEKCGDLFCAFNENMEKVSLGNLKEYGENFFYSNPNVRKHVLKNADNAICVARGCNECAR